MPHSATARGRAMVAVRDTGSARRRDANEQVAFAGVGRRSPPAAAARTRLLRALGRRLYRCTVGPEGTPGDRHQPGRCVRPDRFRGERFRGSGRSGPAVAPWPMSRSTDRRHARGTWPVRGPKITSSSVREFAGRLGSDPGQLRTRACSVRDPAAGRIAAPCASSGLGCPPGKERSSACRTRSYEVVSNGCSSGGLSPPRRFHPAGPLALIVAWASPATCPVTTSAWSGVPVILRWV